MVEISRPFARRSLSDDPLPEMAAEPVVVEAVSRWHGLLGAALEGTADLHLRAGDAAAASAAVAAPLGVPAPRADGRARGARAVPNGRQADALRVVDGALGALADTAGLDVGSELTALERQMLEQSPDLDPEPSSFISSLFGETTKSPASSTSPPGSANAAEASSPSWGRRESARPRSWRS